MNEFVLGLDLGQAQDFTAIAIIERDSDDPKISNYYLRHLKRFPLRTPYPEIADHVAHLAETPSLRGYTTLAIDATGVGAPVVDLVRQATRALTYAITITGGDTPNRDGMHWRVPKRDLVSSLQVLFQTERLKIAQALPEASRLIQELLDFRVRITLQAHDTYGAWREGAHDDLVLASAMAAWLSLHHRAPRIRVLR